MADQKISALTELTTPADADEFVIVDKSDTAMAASGTDKRIKFSNVIGRNVATVNLIGTVDATGATDQSSVITAAVAALPSYGGSILLPEGKIKLNTVIDLTNKAVTFRGQYGRVYGGASKGTIFSTGTASMVMFSAAPGSLSHYGPAFVDLGFWDEAGGSTLVRVKDTNRSAFDRCFFRGDSSATVGLQFDWVQSGSDSSWHQLNGCIFDHCGTGILNTKGYGITMNGGEFTTCASWGLDQVAGGHARLLGVKSDESGIRLRGSSNDIISFHYEASVTGKTAIDIDGTGVAPTGRANQIIGGSITAQGDGTDYGVKIGSNASGTGIYGTFFSAIPIANRIVDAGTRTVMFPADYDGSLYAKHPAFDFPEETAPAAPTTNTGRVFCRDNGSGKTQLCVRFPTGAIQVLSTEP